jgi:prepilin-type N-terminal cleavage/methylation domain-containing protein
MKKRGELGRTKGSFTLVEMLVVISIISIVSVLIFVNVRSSQSRARDTRRVADFEVLNNAIQMYYRENGHFPSLPKNCGAYSVDYGWHSAISTKDAEHWVGAPARAKCVTDNFIPDLTPDFIASLPEDPGPAFFYPSSALNARGIVYIHAFSPSGKECYKLLLYRPENRNDQRYKKLWDPVRDGGTDNSIVDGTDISAWSHYSPGCVSR